MGIKNKLRDNHKILSICTAYFILSLIIGVFYPWFSDSVAHMTYAEFILNNIAFPFSEFSLNASKAYVTPPLFHIMLAISKSIFGYYGVLPAFMGSLSIFMTYKLVDLWYDHKIALQSALALALFPFFIIWGARVYIGTSVVAGFLLVFYFYFRYKETGKRKYLYLSFAIGGLLANLKTYGPLASIIVGIHLVWLNKNSYEHILSTVKETVIPGVFGVLISLPWLIRNFFKTGSPLPKVTGVPFTCVSDSALSGIWIFVPKASELVHFSSRITGVMFPSILDGLNRISPFLYFTWFLLPLSLISFVAFGAIEEKENEFAWIWISSVVFIYFIMRYLSQGAISFKYRHFITISPLLALFTARAYNKVSINLSKKRIIAGLFISGLIVQMLASAFIFTDSMNASYGSMGDWVDSNISNDQVIYSPHARQVISYTDNDFKVITRSCKPGYIQPERDFSNELRENADWVVVSDHPAFSSDISRIEDSEKEGALTLYESFDTKKNRIYGEIGREWRIYKVNK